MITSPSGNGVILLGCQLQEDIYEMKSIGNGKYAWSELKQTLKYSKESPIVSYIPGSLVNCH